MMNHILSFRSFFSLLSITCLLRLSAQYCTPGADCTFGDGLTLVQLGPFSNPSGCSSDGTAGYGDFTDLSGLFISPGVPTEASFSAEFGNQFVSMWIDLNDDFNFGPDELFLADLEMTTSGVIYSTEILIPGTTPQGSYRCRFQSAYFADSSLDPCDMPTFGETEDYTIVVTEPPTCFSLLGIEVINPLPNSLELNWADGGNASVWDVEFGESGFSPTGEPSPGFNNVSLPIVVDGLDPATDYTFYVRGDCGMDDTTDVSFWSSPIVGTTACATISPEYLEPFETEFPNCWEEARGGSPLSTYTELIDANWNLNQFPIDGDGSTFSVNLSDNTQNEWLISPIMDMSSGDFQVEFDLGFTGGLFGTQNTLVGDDIVAFVVSNDNGVTWEALGQWDSEDFVQGSTQHFSYDLSGFDSETTRFAFWAFGGMESEFEFITVYVDDFRIDELGGILSAEVVNQVTVNCFNDESGALFVNIIGGISPYIYSWNSGNETEDLENIETGNYVLTVTSADGQTFTSDSVFIPSDLNIGFEAIITNESVDGAGDGAIDITVLGGTEPYNFIWNHGVQEEDVDGLIDALWCVFLTDAQGCQADTCLLVETAPLSLTEVDHILGLSIYPNPHSSVFTVDVELDRAYPLHARIMDMTGRLVQEQDLGMIESQRIQMDTHDLSRGAYLLELRDEEGEVRVIRQLHKN